MSSSLPSNTSSHYNSICQVSTKKQLFDRLTFGVRQNSGRLGTPPGAAGGSPACSFPVVSSRCIFLNILAASTRSAVLFLPWNLILLSSSGPAFSLALSKIGRLPSIATTTSSSESVLYDEDASSSSDELIEEGVVRYFPLQDDDAAAERVVSERVRLTRGFGLNMRCVVRLRGNDSGCFCTVGGMWIAGMGVESAGNDAMRWIRPEPRREYGD